MIQPVPNANFTFLGGRSVTESNDPKYLEYRRQWFENPKNFIVSDFPIHLDVEVTNRCNLSCTFCDKLPLLTKDQIGTMDFSLYKKIVDEGEEKGLYSIKLSYRGEPLLHKQVAEMVAYAKKRGILDIYFNTNAMLLTKEVSLKLMEAGLHRISISIEGTDPVKFERERRGAKFYRIMRNVDALLELREQRGYEHPKVRIQTVRFPGLDLDEYKECWQSHCDEVAAIDYKEAVNRDTHLIVENWACPQLWQRMTIEWDGTIMTCNNDDLRLLTPGNVWEMSVEDCWHDSVVEVARKLHKQGKSHLLESCNGCPWRTTQILKQKRLGTICEVCNI